MEKKILVFLIATALIAGIIGVQAFTSGVRDKSFNKESSIHIDDSKEISDLEESSQLAYLAKITKEQAEAIALKSVSGVIKGSQLENDNGDVVYTIDIINGSVETEVRIDAGNGNILNIEKDNNSDAQQEKNSENEDAD